jgi:hypothetical protein
MPEAAQKLRPAAVLPSMEGLAVLFVKLLQQLKQLVHVGQ